MYLKKNVNLKKINLKSIFLNLFIILCIVGYVFRLIELILVLIKINVSQVLEIIPLYDILLLFNNNITVLSLFIFISVYIFSLIGLILLLLNKLNGFKIWILSRIIFYILAYFIYSKANLVLYCLVFAHKIIFTTFFYFIFTIKCNVLKQKIVNV